MILNYTSQQYLEFFVRTKEFLFGAQAMYKRFLKDLVILFLQKITKEMWESKTSFQGEDHFRPSSIVDRTERLEKEVSKFREKVAEVLEKKEEAVEKAGFLGSLLEEVRENTKP